MDALKVAVVTGGHSFDVLAFHDLFRALKGVDAYIQHMDDFASSSQEVRDCYDVILFYLMLLETPIEEGSLWYTGKPRAALEHLGEKTQGILLLHHALLAYPDWDFWDEIVGMGERRITSYHHDQDLMVKVTSATHAITLDLPPDWEINDETYQMKEIGTGGEVLLTIDHPLSVRSVAWTRQFRQSRVFCFQLGHGAEAYRNQYFQQTLLKGIYWAAEK